MDLQIRQKSVNINFEYSVRKKIHITHIVTTENYITIKSHNYAVNNNLNSFTTYSSYGPQEDR